jgi:amidohydrolase
VACPLSSSAGRCYDVRMTTLASEPVSSTTLRELIAAEMPDLIAVRHDLHAHPEIGYEEDRTSQVVQRELNNTGVEFAANLAGGTGVLGYLPASGGSASSIHNPKPRIQNSIGLRADMDALPIEETSGLSYASTVPGKMHACGHDGHTTILIGAARVLAKLARSNHGGLPRPVAFFFQPAEEGGAGAQKMIDDGCLHGKVLGPPVREMFGLHGWPRLPQGVVATKPGPLLAASDRFDITVKGVGAHAAFPHASRDPVVAAAAIVSALQTIASRNIGPLESVVVSVTMVHAGSAYNVIPSLAKIGGTVRWLTPQVLDIALRRLNEIATAVAKAYGCEATLDYRTGYPVTLNDPGAVDTFNRVAIQSIGEQRVLTLPQPVMGGEDFSFYCHHVPSCFFVLGLIPPGKQSMPDLHQPDFNFNDDAIPLGVEMFCRLALREN